MAKEYFYVEPTTGDGCVFTFASVGMGSVSNMPSLQYSFDKQTWTTWNWIDDGGWIYADYVWIDIGNRLYIKGVNSHFAPEDASDSKFIYAISNGQPIKIGGNLSSLLLGDNMGPVTTTANCFYVTFGGDSDTTYITDMSDLVCDVMGEYCYAYTFHDQTSLTAGPQLPIRELQEGCYSNMFNGCSSLGVYSSAGSGHTNLWRVPTSGNLTRSLNDTNDMFVGTLGDYTSTSPSTTDTVLSFYVGWEVPEVAMNIRLKDGENVLYPQTKLENISDMETADLVCGSVDAGLVYETTAPTSANESGLKICVLTAEPATKYDGWLYIITEA